ncbi:hypothetical protein BB561_003413 [Smittium simulii]|uniref:AAA+ ATPase domain-containing protein n=1 Tax=Smittium simulii TaxID=133385 RepID=A0A2T9YLP4_9FUNG|nr:hypothetical protein BB561_003413 [Smittium simulii]
MENDSTEAWKKPELNKTTTDNLMWIEKYRPETLKDLVSQDQIIQTIKKYVDLGGLPHLLFYGPPGTGKTSTILALAREIYGKSFRNMVLELNASDDRGIDVVREQIRNFASTSSVFGFGAAVSGDMSKGGNNYKMIILDEADSMTQAAQAALRRVIEKYTKNVRFCIICNYASKITPAIHSRCTKFRFKPLNQDQIRGRLNYIIKQESVSIDSDAVDAILDISKGDMRRVLNILQGCYLSHETIDFDSVYSVTGQPRPSDIKLIFQSLLNDEFSVCHDYISKVKFTYGIALADIITNLLTPILSCSLPPSCITYLVSQLAEIEYRLANSSSDEIQLSALVGTFKIAVEKAA